MVWTESTRALSVAILTASLLGCSQGPSGVRVTNESAAPPPVPAAQKRHEPVFYNGKTYQLAFAPTAGGSYAMAVSGMSANQQKDAVAVATSSLRYFKCPDGQTGVLVGQPKFVEAEWRLTAKCG